jgi:2-polyprenyl-3-methyl-5-hydroxy-6-metoxy-1,4-benzoquinol methylase
LNDCGFDTEFYDLHFASETAWNDKTYDLITLTEVLEHLEEPLSTLRSLKERLSRRGVIALMTQFHPEDDGKFMDWWYRRDITHISFFSERTLRAIAGKLDLQVRYTDGKSLCALGDG